MSRRRESRQEPTGEDSWFDQPPVPSWPPPSSRPPPPPIGHPVWSTLLGAVAGGLGGFAMLIVAQDISAAGRVRIDLVRMLGAPITRAVIRDGDPRTLGLVCAIVMGAVIGAPLGYVARRMIRLAPRLLFFSVLTPVAWTFVQAFVIGRTLPRLATALPFGPLVAGALIYGACVAVVPMVRRPESGR